MHHRDDGSSAKLHSSRHRDMHASPSGSDSYNFVNQTKAIPSSQHFIRYWDIPLSNLLDNGEWNLELLQDIMFRPIKDYVQALIIHAIADRLMWDRGPFTFKLAWESCRITDPDVDWFKFCWGKSWPRWSVFGVFLFQDRLPTMVNLQRRKVQLAPWCSLCLQEYDTRDHLFVGCSYAISFWKWIVDIMGWNFDISLIFTFEDLLYWFSQQTNKMIYLIFVATLWSIWQERNGRLHGHLFRLPQDAARQILFEVLDIYNVAIQDFSR
ncbi:uncharacterized protein LOC132272433 [Cornus florida]|uniref:uncharacterized protein LOC132272433 n=1 Tax=Cornus florida TaxID=4283 RepID=UPI0028A0BCDA|nr:uncharacterized protein LOC132272433 [Cornus florida]